jgi:phenylpyruvate tautomerase PptA (4-oxalocrotonate tautomerase family)
MEEAIQIYQEIIEKRYLQYRELLRRGELVKAGEILWSIILLFLNMLSLLVLKKPIRRHREVKAFVKNYVTKLYKNIYGDDPSRVLVLFEEAEKLHANFYHEFLDEEEILRAIGAGEELAKILRGIEEVLLKK